MPQSRNEDHFFLETCGLPRHHASIAKARKQLPCRAIEHSRHRHRWRGAVAWSQIWRGSITGEMACKYTMYKRNLNLTGEQLIEFTSIVRLTRHYRLQIT